MIFTSVEFLIFFPVVVIAYFLAPVHYRWALLLAASYYFYASWRPEYLGLIIFATLVDYAIGILLDRIRVPSRRRMVLLVSIIMNLGLLGFFKYFNFLGGALQSGVRVLGGQVALPMIDVLLPVGISFYTFQAMSYTIDVYRGRQRAERHLGKFALFIAFFPQLVAGPIERARNLLPQFNIVHRFDRHLAVGGVQLMAWGCFKKLVIADRLAVIVDTVYAAPAQFSGLTLLVATVLFGYQIYCDFSGYVDIGIGAARVMGFRLSANFRQPYFSRSIAEFWRRWHITLCAWFREYLYIPLGGNRVSVFRRYVNVFIVFFVSGLWHGASWTFIAWGALHGCFMIIGIMTRSFRQKWVDHLRQTWLMPAVRPVQVFTTFSLVSFAWIFFRAETIGDATFIIRRLLDSIRALSLNEGLSQTFAVLGGWYGIALMLTLLVGLESVQLIQWRWGIRSLFMRQPAFVRWSTYYALVGSIVLFGVFGRNEFIYFQF